VTEAVASGAGQIPALVERLRTTEAKRRDAPLWPNGSAPVRGLDPVMAEDRAPDEEGLANSRSLLNEGNVARTRRRSANC
jgi:hypothetical protein